MIKKILKLFSFFMLLFIPITKEVNAENYSDYMLKTYDKVPGVYVTKKSSEHETYDYMYIIARESDKQFVYCIQPGVHVSDNKYVGITSGQEDVSNLTTKQLLRMKRLAYYGYGYVDRENGIDHTDKKWYAVTQFLIWDVYPNGHEIYFTRYLQGPKVDMFTSEIEELNRLVDEHTITPSISSDSKDLSIGESITLTDTNGVLKNYNVSTSNNNISVLKSNNNLIITANNAGDATISMTKNNTHYSVPPIVYTNGNYQKLMSVGDLDPIQARLSINVVGGKIKIEKLDSETNSRIAQGQGKLTGAIYEVYNSNNVVVSTLNIGDDNTATTDYLPLGTYTIKEKSSSLGYKIDSSVYTVEINSSAIVNLTVKEDVIKGKIKLLKYDEDNNSCNPRGEASLVGSKYDIYNWNAEKVETITIGSDCSATSSDLPYGKYTIKESKADRGYLLDENTYNVDIKTDSVVNITSKDKVIENKFELYKFYGNFNTGFIYSEPNAKFNIIDSNNNIYQTITTNSDGYASITLPYGNYTVKQISGLDKYKMVDSFNISVSETTEQNQIKYIKNGPISARLKVVKIDSDTKNAINLSGFKFKIKNLDTNEFVCQTTDKVVCEFETNENGVLLTPLPLFGGNYELVEIQSVPNYLLSNESIKFTINDTSNFSEDTIYGTLIEIKFENKAVKGEIEINKIGEEIKYDNGIYHYEEKLLDDVEFNLIADEDIYLQDGTLIYSNGDVVKNFKTDNGYYKISNLPLGKYCLIETNTIEGYKLDADPHCFELKYQDENTNVISKTFTLKNYLIKGNLEITKTDFSTGKPVNGALIEIFTLDDILVFSGYTNNEGKIKVNNLAYGKYKFIESEAPEGYLLNEETHFFEIKEDGSIIKDTLTNEKFKGTFELSKVDIVSGEPVANALIKIFNEYDEEVFSGYTDENGYIRIENLPYGKYKYFESEAPVGYTLNSETYTFEIKENGEIVKAIMTNTKEIIDVPNTYLDTNYIAEITAGILFLTSIGIILYEINKKNKK